MKFIIIPELENAGNADYNELLLIPQPLNINTLNFEKAFKLDSKKKVFFVNCKKQDRIFNNIIEHMKASLDIEFEKATSQFPDMDLLNSYDRVHLLNEKDKGGYNLEISNDMVIIYSLSEKGLFSGVQTFIQILKNAYINKKEKDKSSLMIPEIKIRDSPDLEIRGVAQDVSRGQVCTVENAKRYIKILSHYKMNFYCLYMEDMFAHPDHPLIGKDRGAFTCEEIREIDAYAKEHFVELVPIFECLGHVDNIMQHKKYWDLGEFPGAHSLDISNPDIYPFLTDYISEISKCFSTNYFHIGCDESFDIGTVNSKEYVEKVGKAKALTIFYNQIFEITRNQGNEHVIMYDDMVRSYDAILEELDKDMILMYWHYGPKLKNPPVDKFIDAGFRVIVSPAMLNWNRNFPDNKNASKNIAKMVDLAYEYRNKGCLGILNSTWGDQRYFSLRENEIFGAVLSAGKAWNVTQFNYDEFKRKYGFLFYGLDTNNLNAFNSMFTTLSSSAECYYRLRSDLPPLFYTDLFKHPFPSPKFKPGLKDYEELKQIGEKAMEIYEQLLENVKFERNNFEYIKYGAELAKYCGEKVENSVKIADKLRKGPKSERDLQEIIEKIKNLRDKVIYLKEKYETLWLRAAKRPCLDYNLRLFDFLKKAYNEKIAQIQNNIYFKNPFLESEWIWVDEKTCPPQSRLFRKIVNINKPIEKALLQATVCNHMKIFINGKFIGDILGRLSLSRIPIIKRVKVFDITDHLKSGDNVLAVEAYNYDGFKGAINLFGQIKLEDDSVIEIITDESWVCTKDQSLINKEWQNLNYNHENWNSVKSYGPPPNLNGDLIKPNLIKGEISLTQNYFGAQGYLLKFFHDSPIIQFIMRHIIGLIMKIGKLYG